jgi:protein arginine N-methyltransferase 3
VALAARSRVDQLYFESYSYFDIHREMLGDKVGTQGVEGVRVFG